MQKIKMSLAIVAWDLRFLPAAMRRPDAAPLSAAPLASMSQQVADQASGGALQKVHYRRGRAASIAGGMQDHTVIAGIGAGAAPSLGLAYAALLAVLAASWLLIADPPADAMSRWARTQCAGRPFGLVKSKPHGALNERMPSSREKLVGHGSSHFSAWDAIRRLAYQRPVANREDRISAALFPMSNEPQPHPPPR